ncbi:MAG: hypothetical protein NXI12_09775 [Alphaproteobacteria bacterium]|nr:hypothetical protein [Alphaproteobacteria bacterium]
MSDDIRKQLEAVLADTPVGEELPPEALSRIVGGFGSQDDSIGGGNGDGANLNHHLSDGPYSKAWGRST